MEEVCPISYEIRYIFMLKMCYLNLHLTGCLMFYLMRLNL